MRIVHCFRNPVGGLFRHVRDLCNEQAAAGHQVGVICDSKTGGAFEEAMFAELKPHLALGLVRLPMNRQIAFSDIAAAQRVLSAVRPMKPDVLHGHGAKGGAYARWAGTRLGRRGRRPARIYTPHGGSLHYDARRLKYRAFFAVERLLGRMTDAFVFVSQYEADAYAAKVGAPHFYSEIVPNGLRSGEFERVEPKDNASDFLFVGMLRDLKGPDVFIEALAILRERGTRASARIYGAGDDSNRYKAMIEERGLTDVVSFHEPTPARTAFRTGKVLVVPSRAESMPYIVLEAAAASVPMIATSVGGIPEIFGPEAGRLVPAGDPDELAKAMEASLGDPAAARSAAAALHNVVGNAHTADAMAAAVEAVYRRALRPRSRTITD
ncbi:MAG: glycosyltransferase family 4 protein [Alphaproteobacteria bacterium]